MSKKQSIRIAAPTGSKRIKAPEASSAESTNDLHPAFCFKYIQAGFTITDCDKNESAMVAKALQSIGQLTWSQIQSADRHGKGHEIIAHNSFKASIPPNTPGDRDFLSFRLGSAGSGLKSVLIGYRKNKVFYILWVDPKGKAYRH